MVPAPTPSLAGPGGGRPRPGRDRAAGRVPAPDGRASAADLADQPRVAVVGGGIGGLAAAVGLAERGVSVRLFEREPDLGGRLRGWTASAQDSPVTMSRGFHAFFRQYYNLRALFRRVDPSLDMFRPVPDYPLLHANGAVESFARLPRTPPWNVAGFVLRSSTFHARDIPRMNLAAAMRLFDISVPGVYAELDDIDATRFLDDIGFPAAARHLAFEVFARSFFADPQDLSAAELAAMFHIYFLGSSEGLLFDVPRRPFPQALWWPLREYLERLGAGVSVSTTVERVTRAGDRFRVETATQAMEVDAVVLATDVAALRRLVEASTGLGGPAWRDAIDSLRTAPPFLVSRLWLDRPVSADRAPFLATSGFARLDNVSVLDLFEDEARDWRRRTGGSVVELHAYSLHDHDAIESTEGGSGREAIAAELVAELGRVYPELRAATTIHAEHVLAEDCPLFSPGSFGTRPQVATDDPGVVLAGDGIRVDLPVALMERAATTGFTAANALLERFGLRGHDLWSVGNRGRSGLLRGLARRAHPR